MSETQALEARIVELETRLAFQEQLMSELNDALSAMRLEGERQRRVLSSALEDLRQARATFVAAASEETPPPHY